MRIIELTSAAKNSRGDRGDKLFINAAKIVMMMRIEAEDATEIARTEIIVDGQFEHAVRVTETPDEIMAKL
jgi:hypothetical protein